MGGRVRDSRHLRLTHTDTHTRHNYTPVSEDKTHHLASGIRRRRISFHTFRLVRLEPQFVIQYTVTVINTVTTLYSLLSPSCVSYSLLSRPARYRAAHAVCEPCIFSSWSEVTGHMHIGIRVIQAHPYRLPFHWRRDIQRSTQEGNTHIRKI